ncbi:hypothetical protein GGI07_001422 [Coemansia sp. Benny D115]|nr:hypothetical protein GGI07_001422 [Coemansia sp. Benny D115]
MYGLTEVSQTFDIQVTLEAIVSKLKKTYCANISYEFEHISSPTIRKWFSAHVESLDTSSNVPERHSRFYELLAKAEVFEHFLQKKLPNVKRYGLEGSESMVVLLDQLIYEGAKLGISEVVAGLTHRGRMSILATLFGYPLDELLRKLHGGSEFSDDSPHTGDILVDLAKPGVVRYPDIESPINIDVLWNACHLESGTPVGMGKSRTKDINIARSKNNPNYIIGDNVLPISLHGDSSFAGQGVIAESLAMAGLAHFNNGGTIHVINNNQVGYTTPASHTRTTRYASDIAKAVDMPVIHVNGEYPEEVARAACIAVAYRQKFRKDVIIDMWTFRKRGHNEIDEPSFTQPTMYKTIGARKSIPVQFEERLIASGHLQKEKADAVKREWLNTLNAAFVNSAACNPVDPERSPSWKMLGAPGSYPTEAPTGVDESILHQVGIDSVAPGNNIKVHPRIERFHIKPRLKKLQEGKGIDWATAEALAFGTLLREGYNVRLSGQDVGRGTFSQRHAMFVCQETDKVYVPLNRLSGKSQNQSIAQGKLEVVNSNLCEEAVVGFEYGVSTEDPFTLAIWEAQFGDFYNNSQAIVDGYIVSGETKWGQQNGLVMLLPHGFDGGGPDHSSCRLERHLLLSNDPVDRHSHPHARMLPNVYVAYPTTPAQFFHLLRRQVKRNFRKPLIVASPKTMLRLASASSSLSEMAPGTQFKPVLDDSSITNPQMVKRVMMVSGKLYYDLAKAKSEHPLGEHVAIVRVEELSPFPREELYHTLAQYTNASDFVWVQEEPRNAGAYSFVAPRIRKLLPEHIELRYVGRPEHAATCSGVETQQAAEHAQLTGEAFDGLRGLLVDMVMRNMNMQHGQLPVSAASTTSKMPLDKPAATIIPASAQDQWTNRPMYAAQSSEQ